MPVPAKTHPEELGVLGKRQWWRKKHGSTVLTRMSNNLVQSTAPGVALNQPPPLQHASSFSSQLCFSTFWFSSPSLFAPPLHPLQQQSPEHPSQSCILDHLLSINTCSLIHLLSVCRYLTELLLCSIWACISPACRSVCLSGTSLHISDF